MVAFVCFKIVFFLFVCLFVCFAVVVVVVVVFVDFISALPVSICLLIPFGKVWRKQIAKLNET